MPASQEDDPNPEPNLSPACPMTIMPSFTSINMLYHSEPSDQDTFIPDASDNEYSSSQPCSCHTLLRQKLDGTHGLLEDKEGLLLVSTAIRCRLDRLCHFHLRKLAKSSIGLKNNITGAKIIHRLSLVNRYGRRLQQMRASYPNWFVKERRPPTKVDRLGVYQYSAVALPPFQLDCRRILERFAGPGSWEIWEKEGTLIIPNVFDFLNKPDILQIINQEFAMYQHHSIPKAGRPRQGWCRNMYYSLVQQLIRQDPIWYSLCAALQGKSELISHPYIAKDANPGEKTGFLHLDINVNKYSEYLGDTLHLLSSSVSLDNEVTDGCTVVVPGFHHHIHEWFRMVKARGASADGCTTDCSSIYRKEDQQTWGKPQPVPCPAFSLRITRPDIIHGSTNLAPVRRRTLFAWYRAIGADHETLEGEGSLTWSDLAVCHRDLVIPLEEPSGQHLKHPVPREPFPGAVVLPPVAALGDALLGRRRWTDPMVIKER